MALSQVRSKIIKRARLARGSFLAAGVDLSELVKISTSEAHSRRFLADLTDAFAIFRKPIVAAVVGFAVRAEHPASHPAEKPCARTTQRHHHHYPSIQASHNSIARLANMNSSAEVSRSH
jgi:hypothetical protein